MPAKGSSLRAEVNPPGQLPLTEGAQKRAFRPTPWFHWPRGFAMRQPKPWFRTDKNAWYVQIGRARSASARTRPEAHRRFYRLMAEEGLDTRAPARGPTIQVALACDLYLEGYSSRHHAPGHLRAESTSDSRTSATATAALPRRGLKPFHVHRWLEDHDWSASTRRGAIAVLKAALNCAVEQGYIPDNPIRSLRSGPRWADAKPH